MVLLEKLTLFSIGMVVGMGPHMNKIFVCMVFCQAQFQLASSVLVELRLALLSLSDHPPHPTHSDMFTSKLLNLLVSVMELLEVI